jgi:hypothetical protein
MPEGILTENSIASCKNAFGGLWWRKQARGPSAAREVRIRELRVSLRMTGG